MVMKPWPATGNGVGLLADRKQVANSSSLLSTYRLSGNSAFKKGIPMFDRRQLLVCGALLFAGLTGASVHAEVAGKVVVDGSSTVAPITMAVAEEFQKLNKECRVTVGISGTGGGFKRFAVGETDISDASRPIKDKEAAACKEKGVEYVEIPVALDGLSIVVSKDNTWAKDITVEELKKIFIDGSTVKSWKDVRPEYPDVPLKLFSPGTDSGTFDYFKEVVVDKGSIRADIAVSEDDNVLVRGITGDKGALGYFGCAYYFENKTKVHALAVHNGKKAVLPTPENIESAEYAPFSRPLFIYVNTKSAQRPEVKAFVEYYLKVAPKLVAETGYVPLNAALYDLAKKNFAAKKTGTQFLTEDGKHKKGALAELYH